MLLNYKSEHPESTKRSITVMQMKRATILADTEEGVKEGMQKMTMMLSRNAYPETTIRRHGEMQQQHKECLDSGPNLRVCLLFHTYLNQSHTKYEELWL